MGIAAFRRGSCCDRKSSFCVLAPLTTGRMGTADRSPHVSPCPVSDAQAIRRSFSSMRANSSSMDVHLGIGNPRNTIVPPEATHLFAVRYYRFVRLHSFLDRNTERPIRVG